MQGFKNVTFMAEVESKEVKERLKEIERKQSTATLILVCILFVSLIISIILQAYQIAIVVFVVEMFIFYLVRHYFNDKKRPLKEVYTIAQHNDMIRHDEMIRFRERQRLEELYKPKEPTNQEKETVNVEKETTNAEVPNDVKSDFDNFDF